MFASDIGASMQTVGSGWLMTSLAPSPFVVALLQVMTSLSIFLLAFPAGALADIVDRRKLFLTTQYFSLVAAIGLASGLVLSISYKLKPHTDVDLTPSMHWYMPREMIDIDDHADGSVLVEMEFQIDPKHSQEFEFAMNDIRSLILRDGAISWDLFHDIENPSRYVMRFTSESWTEHLRQHERMTKADLAIEQRAISFHIGKDPPRISHFISEDMSKQNHKTKKEIKD